MTELKKKPLFNPEGDPDVRLRRMIGGNTTNLRDPKVVHGLPVPVADPSVLHIVEVVEVGGIAAAHAPRCV